MCPHSASYCDTRLPSILPGIQHQSGKLENCRGMTPELEQEAWPMTPSGVAHHQAQLARKLLQSGGGGGFSSGVIAGIAVAAGGGVLLLGLIILVVVLFIRKRRAEGRPSAAKVKSAMLSWKDIEIGPEIGQGGFGNVFKGKWQGNRVAIKMLRPDRQDTDTLSRLKQEALLQMDLAHPFIARIYGLVLEKPHYALIMHYYRGGTVEEFIKRPKKDGVLAFEDLDIVYRIRMCLQVAKAMMFLHDRRPMPIVHGDLKTQNLLMDFNLQNDPRTIRVAVADFGLARPLLQTRKAKVTAGNSVVTAHISPPEVISNPDAPRARAVDVYAFAVVLLEITTGQPAYDQRTAPKLIMRNVARGERPPLPKTLPAAIGELITSCWAQDPEQRPSFVQIVMRLECIERDLISSMNNRTQYDHTGYL